MKKTTALTLILIMLLTICFDAGCAAKASDVPVSATGLYFDTMVNITLYSYPGSSDQILTGCLDMCEKYESLFSATIEGSDIWRINHAKELITQKNDTYASLPIKADDGSLIIAVDPETAEIIRKALGYCDMSEGAVDITIGTLTELWNIKERALSDAPSLPEPADIGSALSHVNYKNISVLSNPADIISSRADNDPGTQSYIRISDPDIHITLGFIAKGYIADRICEYLKDCGVTSALINLGGNIVTLGAKPDGSSFVVGIQEPFADRGTPLTSVALNDMSVVSSGIYERYFEKDGHIYHHILDPKKGYPTDEDVLGVSIISKYSADADALSTLCLVLGPKKGCELIESIDNTEVLYVTGDYKVITSSGWNSYTVTP